MLELKNFSAGYSARSTVLHNFSLVVEKGAFVGLLGPNGSGKSSLLHAMAGFLPAQTGNVSFKNIPLAKFTAKERARKIALLPQQMADKPNFKAFDIVCMGRYPYLTPWQGLSKADIMYAVQAMERTSSLKFAERLLPTLSGGEAQRVFAAQTLAQEAELLLLDEVSASLDMARVVELFCLLRSLTQASGTEQKTVVAAMHDLNLAGAFCKQLVLLKNGCVLASGLTEQVFTGELLSELYETPITVFTHPQSGVPQALLQIPE